MSLCVVRYTPRKLDQHSANLANEQVSFSNTSTPPAVHHSRDIRSALVPASTDEVMSCLTESVIAAVGKASERSDTRGYTSGMVSTHSSCQIPGDPTSVEANLPVCPYVSSDIPMLEYQNKFSALTESQPQETRFQSAFKVATWRRGLEEQRQAKAMRKGIAHLEQKQLKTLSTYFRMLSVGCHFCLTARGAFRRWSTACQLKTVAMWNRRLAMARGLASLRAEAIRIAGVVRQGRPELSAFSRLIRMRDEARSDRLRLREATGLLARRVRDFRKGLIVFERGSVLSSVSKNESIPESL